MPNPRNVLFLMTDQHRVDTLGCYGNPVVETPALDSLAASGARFDRAYTPIAICTPARASLLTGLHPFRHKLLTNYEWISGHREELPDELPVLSQILRRRGCNAGHVGKWHVGRQRGPEHYGFDGEHLLGALNPVDHPDYKRWLSERALPSFAVKDPIYGVRHDGARGHLLAGRLQQPAEASFEAYLTERTLDLIRTYADDWHRHQRPFFLECNWFGPHLPYLIPEEYYNRYDPADVPVPASMAETFAGKPSVQRRYSEYWSVDHFDVEEWRALIAVYWGYVTLIDEQVCRLIRALQEFELWDDTAVVFAADHGEFTGAHRLNDKGPAMYEDIYRIPTIVRLPGCEPRVVDRFTTLIDLNPTVLDLMGIPSTDPCDGRSLLPLVEGKAPDDWRREVVTEFHGHHFPYPQRMIRDERYKLIINPESVNELYDLSVDPDELRNVYETPAYGRVRQGLSRRLYRELRARGDRFFQWMSFTADLGDEQRYQRETSLESKL